MDEEHDAIGPRDRRRRRGRNLADVDARLAPGHAGCGRLELHVVVLRDQRLTVFRQRGASGQDGDTGVQRGEAHGVLLLAGMLYGQSTPAGNTGARYGPGPYLARTWPRCSGQRCGVWLKVYSPMTRSPPGSTAT